MDPRASPCEDADSRRLRFRPRRIDDALRLRADDRLRFAPDSIEVAFIDQALGLETRRVRRYRDRVADQYSYSVAIHIALLARLRILPGRVWIASEIQHVVVVSVAAHPHGNELDERGTFTRTGALGRPRERGGDDIGVCSVERDPRDAIPGSLVGEYPDGRLVGDRGRQRRLIVLHAENRRQTARPRRG